MTRLILALIAVLVVLLPAAEPVRAASCNGASHDMTLSVGTATPGTGTTATPITFSVRYTDNGACAPTAISVAIAGAGTYRLHGAGSDYASGVAFSATLTLPAGRHGYSFQASSGSGVGERTVKLTTVNPVAVTITAPTPLAPTPKPSPPPATPAPPVTPPAPPATPPPAVTPQPIPPAPTESPPPEPTATPEPSPSDRPMPVLPVGSWMTPAEQRGASGAAGNPWRDPGIPPGRVVAPAEPWEVTRPGDGPALKPYIWDLTIPGPILPFTVSTLLGLALFAALTRRRTPSEPQLVGAGVVAMAQTPVDAPQPLPRMSLPPMRELIPELDPHLLDIGDEVRHSAPGEENMPRWLRPSVREARFAGDRSYRRER